MPIFWVEPDYIVALLIWLGVLGYALRILLRWRQSLKRVGNDARAVQFRVWSNAGLGAWCLLAALTACEVFFACCVDHTDAFNMTNVSQRWFRRHIDAERNSDGFRNRRDLQGQRPSNTRRIVFFGDSFTIGHGIRRMEDRFTDLIESRLNAVSSTVWEVFNLGDAGYDISLVEGLVKATTLQDGFEADVFVYVYMLNDIEGYDPRTSDAIRKIQQRQPKSWLTTRTYFFNWLYFRWQQYTVGQSGNYFTHLEDSYRSAPWEAIPKSLASMKSMCRERGIDFRVAIFPFLHNLGSDYSFHHAHELLVCACQDLEIPVLDLEPILVSHLNEDLVVNRYDNHPNEHAHAIVAEAIQRNLLGDLVEPVLPQ